LEQAKEQEHMDHFCSHRMMIKMINSEQSQKSGLDLVMSN